MKPKKTITPPPAAPASPPDSGGDQRGSVQKLHDQIQALDTNWKRALADYQNLLKRIDSDKKDFAKFSTANLVSGFLPALDALDMAATHSSDPGIKMAVKLLHDALKDTGVIEISPAVGDIHNPLFEECLETISGQPDNTIAEVTQTGYKLEGDFVIRPAKVKVFKLALDK